MASGGDIQTAQIVGWVVTGAAFAGNLLWNFLNRRHANNLADQIRLEQYAREVWERHRSRIEARLEEFVSIVTDMPGQLLALPDVSDRTLTMDVWGYNLTLMHDYLARALSDADESAYCEGSDWEACATGSEHGSEQSWDLVLAIFEQAREAVEADRQLALMKSMAPYALEIERVIRRKIREVDFRYQP